MYISKIKNPVLWTIQKAVKEGSKLDQRDYMDPDPQYRTANDYQCFYDDQRGIRSDVRRFYKAARQFIETGQPEEKIIEASPHTFSGRLELSKEGDEVTAHYTVGQFGPTEIPNAAACVIEYTNRLIETGAKP